MEREVNMDVDKDNDVGLNTNKRDVDEAGMHVEQPQPLSDSMIDGTEDDSNNAVQRHVQDGPRTQPVRSILRKSHGAAEGETAGRPELRHIETGISEKEGEKSVKFDPSELEQHEIEAATRMLNRELEGAKLASDEAKTPWPWQVDNPDFEQIPPLDLSPRSASAISPASSRKSSISGSSIVQPGSPGSRRSSSSSGKRVLLDLPTDELETENYDSARSDRFNKLRKEHYAMTGNAMRNALRSSDQDMQDSAIESSGDEAGDSMDVGANDETLSNGSSSSRGKRVLLNLPDDASKKEDESSAKSDKFNRMRKEHYARVGAAMRESLGKDDSSEEDSGNNDDDEPSNRSVPPVPPLPNGNS